jgi:hypothetical protein
LPAHSLRAFDFRKGGDVKIGCEGMFLLQVDRTSGVSSLSVKITCKAALSLRILALGRSTPGISRALPGE